MDNKVLVWSLRRGALGVFDEEIAVRVFHYEAITDRGVTMHDVVEVQRGVYRRVA